MKQLCAKISLMMLLIVLFSLFHFAVATAGIIGVRSSTGVKNSDGASYLQGDGFTNPGADCIVQCIYAGSDGVINPPNPADGNPTGDDQLLEMEEVAGRYYTVIGEGYPFSPNAGKFAEDFRHSLNSGNKIYCRAWNSFSFATATCYGDSPLYALENTIGETHNFGTWMTDSCNISPSTTTVELTTTTVESTTTIETTTSTTEPVTTSTIPPSTTSVDSTTTVEPTTTTIEPTTTSVESTTTVQSTTTTVEPATTSIIPTTTTTVESTTTIEPTTSTVESTTTTSIASTTTVQPTTTTVELTTTSVEPTTSSILPTTTTSVASTTTVESTTTTVEPVTTSIPNTTTSIVPVSTTTTSQKTSTTTTIVSSTTTTVEALTADFTADARIGRAPRAVQFTSNCTGIISGYKWTFGDGAESSEEHPKHTYKKKGTYDVSLTVTRAGGATATETKENYITVKGFCPLARSLNNEQDIETLQKVRERMLPSITGIVLVSIYYRNAFEMVQMLEENPLLQERLREVVAKNIQVAEQLIAGEDVVVSAEQTAEVVQFLKAIKARGSLRLQNDIDMLIVGLEDGYLLQGLGIQVE